MLIAIDSCQYISTETIRKVLLTKKGLRVYYSGGETEFFEGNVYELQDRLDNQIGPVIPAPPGWKVAVYTAYDDGDKFEDSVRYTTPVGFRIGRIGRSDLVEPVLIDSIASNQQTAIVDPLTGDYTIAEIARFKTEDEFKEYAKEIYLSEQNEKDKLRQLKAAKAKAEITAAD